MIGPAEMVAAVMLVSLALYSVTGGADFGGGVWDLLATGPRAAAQRQLIERTIAPIWEANHVWLIFVVVLLFSAFPPAFSAASIALHIPLSLNLAGIVLRGSAFVFRHYGEGSPRASRRWGRVFAIASTVTPVLLGMSLGALTAGRIRLREGVPISGFVRPWLDVFPICVGLLVLALFALLAAVYLTNETSDPELREDFCRRALVAGLAVGMLALVSALVAGPGTVHFRRALLGSWWSLPLQILTGLVALSVLAALWTRRFRLARPLAIVQAGLIVLGWGLAQRPYLIAPDLTIEDAAVPVAVLKLLLVLVAAGAVLLLPSLYFLFRVFRNTGTSS